MSNKQILGGSELAGGRGDGGDGRCRGARGARPTGRPVADGHAARAVRSRSGSPTASTTRPVRSRRRSPPSTCDSRAACLAPRFLNARYFCNGPALRDALDADLTGIPFTQRVANLQPFIHSLAHSRSKAGRAALANARVCDRARVGRGTAQIDARTLTPVLSGLIPARFSAFLSRGTVPGAIAGVAILGAADLRGSLVQRFPVIAGVHAAVDGQAS